MADVSKQVSGDSTITEHKVEWRDPRTIESRHVLLERGPGWRKASRLSDRVVVATVLGQLWRRAA